MNGMCMCVWCGVASDVLCGLDGGVKLYLCVVLMMWVIEVYVWGKV